MLKRLLTRLTPARLRDLRLRKAYGSRHTGYEGMKTERIFGEIYSGNRWGNAESVSGAGSTLAYTQFLLPQLERLFADRDIRKVLDIPCGDFHWLQHLDWSQREYVGGDIVEELIARNQAKFGERHTFATIDLIHDSLPEGDLLLVRDCFVHLSEREILAALQNIRQSGITYLLTTHFPKLTINFNIQTGDWRPLNLCLPPYSLPQPLESLTEYCHPGYEHENRGKCLGLWKVSDLNK